jgi:hypothetical protein
MEIDFKKTFAHSAESIEEFNTIDLNGNGAVDENELAKAVNNPGYLEVATRLLAHTYVNDPSLARTMWAFLPSETRTELEDKLSYSSLTASEELQHFEVHGCKFEILMSSSDEQENNPPSLREILNIAHVLEALEVGLVEKFAFGTNESNEPLFTIPYDDSKHKEPPLTIMLVDSNQLHEGRAGGIYNASTNTLKIARNANLNTITHEFAHAMDDYDSELKNKNYGTYNNEHEIHAYFDETCAVDSTVIWQGAERDVQELYSEITDKYVSQGLNAEESVMRARLDDILIQNGAIRGYACSDERESFADTRAFEILLNVCRNRLNTDGMPEFIQSDAVLKLSIYLDGGDAKIRSRAIHFLKEEALFFENLTPLARNEIAELLFNHAFSELLAGNESQDTAEIMDYVLENDVFFNWGEFIWRLDTAYESLEGSLKEKVFNSLTDLMIKNQKDPFLNLSRSYLFSKIYDRFLVDLGYPIDPEYQPEPQNIVKNIMLANNESPIYEISTMVFSGFKDQHSMYEFYKGDHMVFAIVTEERMLEDGRKQECSLSDIILTDKTVVDASYMSAAEQDAILQVMALK